MHQLVDTNNFEGHALQSFREITFQYLKIQF